MLNQNQINKINAGDINTRNEKVKRAIQKHIKRHPDFVTPDVGDAIDKGKELVLLRIPVLDVNESFEYVTTEMDDELKPLVHSDWVEGINQPVYEVLVSKESAKSILKDQNARKETVKAAIELGVTTFDITGMSEDDECYLIERNSFSRFDPVGDEGTFNADKARFLEKLKKTHKVLWQTYMMYEDIYNNTCIIVKENVLASMLGITQGAVSKRLKKVQNMWKRYYR